MGSRARWATAFGLLFLAVHANAADWRKSVDASHPGKFPPPRPLQATYRFGWAGFTAATADVNLTGRGAQLELKGSGRTIGLARALWRIDATHDAVSNVATLRPVSMEQVEDVRGKKIITRLSFNDSAVMRTRSDRPLDAPASAASPKTKRFDFPNLLDLFSSLLYLRSQPLTVHSVQRVVVYPATSAYLATLTVTGHEKISVAAGNYNAIVCDLKLSKVGKNDRLEPHKKFRRATIWISDDADRLLLKAEAQIFVGSVFAELQTVRFNDRAR